MRRNIDDFIRLAFEREQRHIVSAVISIEPVKFDGELVYECRISVWSSSLGLVTVGTIGDSLRTAVQQGILQARYVLRRRFRKGESLAWRFSNRLGRWMPVLGKQWWARGSRRQTDC